MRIKYGIKIKYYENKNYKFNNEFLQKLIYLKNGKLNGEYRMWWCLCGGLAIHCYYENDKLNGEHKLYNFSGTSIKTALYKDGEKIKEII